MSLKARFAEVLASDEPLSVELQQRVARTLIEAAPQDDFLHLTGDDDSKKALLRLISAYAPATATVPPVFAHVVAGTISAGHHRGLAALARCLWPLLADRLIMPTGPGGRQALILAMLLRSWRPKEEKRLEQSLISRLHLAQFPDLHRDEMALLYSVMFNVAAFGRNRDELLAQYWPEGLTAPRPYPELRPAQLTVLHWLRPLMLPRPEPLSAHFLATAALWDAADHAAARALVARCGIGAGGVDAGGVETGGGFDPEVLAACRITLPAPLMAQLAARRAGEGQQAKTVQRQIARVENPMRQALQVARRLALPAVFARGRAPRVALCLSGQLRGYERAFATWRKRVLPGAEVEIFVHGWTGIGGGNAHPSRRVLPFAGRAFPEAWRATALAQGYETLQAGLPTLFTLLRNAAQVSRDHVCAVYGTDHVVLQDDAAPEFAAFSNQQKMHFKIGAADRLARQAGAFDLFVRLRPDLEARLAGFDWRDLWQACRSAPLIFAEKPYGLHYGNLMIGDQLAIAAPEPMARYAETFDLWPVLGTAGLAGAPPDLHGHLSLAASCWQAGIAVRKAPIRLGALLEARPLGCSEILAALEADAAGGAGVWIAPLIAAVRADLKGKAWWGGGR